LGRDGVRYDVYGDDASDAAITGDSKRMDKFEVLKTFGKI
jgi:hypothetical protein